MVDYCKLCKKEKEYAAGLCKRCYQEEFNKNKQYIAKQFRLK